VLSKEEHIAYWLESAERNLISAENNFQIGNYDWCLFIGHLVLEKVLKALFIHKSQNTNPPRTHNLLRLSELSSIELNLETKLFFDKVNSFNLEARYEEYKSEFYKIATKEYSETNFNLIK